MRTPTADAGLHSLPVRLSYLVLISLIGCARAEPPEMFVADPALQDDFTSNLPATGSSAGFNYAIVQGLAIYEGDILLGAVDANGLLKNRFRARGVGKRDAFNRWPDGIVVYETPEDSSEIQQENIAKAMQHWVDNTKISFVERTPENADQYPHFIRFLDTQSCASHVGMIGDNAQPIYLSDACSVGSVIHEIGHAIGLFHEHTRPDRDNFVQIDWDEIVNGKDINFNLQTANVDTYSPYDYGSIMHYGENFFSKSGAPTIIIADGIDIGQREALSPLDIESVDAMYATDLALMSPTIQETGTDLELDISTHNYGTLGAHNIELVLRMGDDSEWKGVSLDSGWECLAYGAELKCTRDTFREQTESRFTVLVDPKSANADDLSAYLFSRTQDSDSDNNGYNDAGVVWESAGGDFSDQSAEDSSSQQVDSLPPQGAAQPRSSEDKEDTSVKDDSSGGGSMQLPMLALLIAMTGIRRRRKR